MMNPLSVAGALAGALAYPRAVDDYVELVRPLASARELRARIVAVRAETHDTATLLLERARGAPFGPHRAGQHVLVGVEVDGVRRTRCFSIASAEGDRPLAITVRARPGGLVTPRLVSGELAGAIVTLSQPMGDFVLPDLLPERILLVSGGSGITPVMSMLRTLARRTHPARVAFLHWARSPRDVIYAEELATRGAHVVHGDLRADDLARLVPDLDAWDAWACGPPAFLEVLARAFRDPSRLRTERFAPPEATGSEGAITFARCGRRADGKGPILETAERAGLAPPSGCRRGICGTCKQRKLAGTTRDLRTGELSTDADVVIPLCVSEPVGPVTIDL